MNDINSIVCPISTFDLENHIIGIIITNTEETNFHCGIVYKHEESSNAIHLAWHFRLENEDNIQHSIPDYYWVKSNIHPIRQVMVSNKCKRIIESKDENLIPYSLLYEGGEFDEEGILHLEGNEHGLTCATFVLSIFKSCGIDLIDLSTWPNRVEDLEFHEKVISLLEKTKTKCGISDKHIENVKKEVGCSRFRPEEVAISSTFDDMPASFEEISTKTRLLTEYIIKKNN